jgi:hypothetical protein
MIELLTFFFAFGFVAGGLGGLALRLFRHISTLSFGAIRWIALIAVAATCLVLAILRPEYHILLSWPLALLQDRYTIAISMCISAAVVGVTAGAWFAVSSRERDRLIFIAVGGGYLFVAALQYETRIFDHLSKLSAGGVNLEFSEAGKKGEEGNAWSLNYTSSDSGNMLIGGNRQDLMIAFLGNLGDMMLRDEQYARLIASQSPDLSGKLAGKTGLRETLPAPSYRMAGYACGQIRKIAADLRALQTFQRSEESQLALRPQLVRLLRLSYMRARKSLPADFADAGHGSRSLRFGGCLRRSDGKPTRNELVCELRRFRQTLASETAALPDPPVEGSYKDQFPSTLCDLAADADPLNVFRGPTPLAASEDARVYVAYLGVIAAIAEYSAGNRENAINLIDSEIGEQFKKETAFDRRLTETPRIEFDALSSASNCPASDWVKTDDCKADAQLSSARREVLIARLYYLEDQLIANSGSSELDPVRMELLIRWTKTLEEGQRQLVRPTGAHETLMFQGDFALDPNADCRASIENDPSASLLAARWAFTLASAKNNALWLAQKRPDLARADPAAVSRLDRFASDIASFEPRCLAKQGILDEGRAVKFRVGFLDTAAQYWRSEASNFGLDDPAPAAERVLLKSEKSRVEELCRARLAYDFALAIERRPNGRDALEPSTLQHLKDRTDQLGEATLPVILEDRAEAISRLLNDASEAAKDSEICKLAIRR